jgi:hypothetical protein
VLQHLNTCGPVVVQQLSTRAAQPQSFLWDVQICSHAWWSETTRAPFAAVGCRGEVLYGSSLWGPQVCSHAWRGGK